MSRQTVPTAQTRTHAPAAAAPEDDVLEECTLWVAFITYLAYFVLVAVGYVKEFLFPVHQKEKDRQVRRQGVPFFSSQCNGRKSIKMCDRLFVKRGGGQAG